MTLERLWAGWRSEYISGVTAAPEPVGADDCLFCRLAAAKAEDALILARDERVFAVMNAYPYTSGHLMVAPLRHEATLAGLDEAEATALMAMTQDATPRSKRRTRRAASTWERTSAAPRVRECRGTSTCMSFHAGTATPIS